VADINAEIKKIPPEEIKKFENISNSEFLKMPF
jgi:hypothetical protein